ncbi:hypothetical protein BJ741DRAFT_111916 [Chytriomyces cf. hyalinus JEL632]|nr:hypothetical protein BJ741DRAFT_111916 [Chytriomyces cf. hyalinus JEL632]
MQQITSRTQPCTPRLWRPCAPPPNDNIAHRPYRPKSSPRRMLLHPFRHPQHVGIKQTVQAILKALHVDWRIIRPLAPCLRVQSNLRREAKDSAVRLCKQHNFSPHAIRRWTSHCLSDPTALIFICMLLPVLHGMSVSAVILGSRAWVYAGTCRQILLLL